MTQRDRLIELMEQANETVVGFYIDGDIGVLADYLIANGVIVPPCKVGQVVYSCMSFENDAVEIVQGVVEEVSLGSDGLWISCSFECGLKYWYPLGNFVKNIYFTEKEAKKALAERKRVNE